MEAQPELQERPPGRSRPGEETGPGPGPGLAPSRSGALPGAGRQKSFIVENAGILNRETKIAILTIVMMEIGPSVVVETGGAREVDVDLDGVADQNEEVLAHIYNIVRARLDTLNQPARHSGAAPMSGGQGPAPAGGRPRD